MSRIATFEISRILSRCTATRAAYSLRATTSRGTPSLQRPYSISPSSRQISDKPISKTEASLSIPTPEPPISTLIDSTISELVGRKLDRCEKSLLDELNRLQSDRLAIRSLVDSEHYKDLITHVKTEDHDTLSSLIANNCITTSAFYILSLLNLPNKDLGYVLLLDNCTSLLLEGKYDLVSQIFTFWNSKCHPTILSSFKVDPISSSDPFLIAAEIVNTACNMGKPLVASAICFRLDEAKLLRKPVVQKVIKLLLISHHLQGQFNIKAIVEMTKRIKTVQITLTTKEKSDIIELAIKLSKMAFPTLINDTYDFVNRVPGGMVPLRTLFELIKINLLHNNTSRASSLTKQILTRQPPAKKLNIEILGLMIREFSKNRKYRDLCKALIDIVPPEYYTADGITGPLFSYCARTKNRELAMEIYSQLEAPIKRNILTSLLHLHISFDDNEGAEKILQEITRRKETLLPIEFAMVVQGALAQKNGLATATKLCRNSSPTVAKLAYGDILNHAIDHEEYDIFNEFIDLAYQNLPESDPIFDRISLLIIKKLLKSHGSKEARLQWIQWQSGSHKASKIRLPSTKKQIIAIRSIADKAIAEGNTQVINWSLHELRHLGVHMADIRKELSHRPKMKNNKEPEFLLPRPSRKTK
ncbi:similar to Saccharomyces cerevisiae YJL209W CBP1 Mitochondrial protein that interacts with the 5'-untranslated region of the COB mRNA [Geotrichum candidum]|uniref:Similar to Saccharomyces cerevisiae YJL209W CBP1 Mitochondrial protein that interacts with the 5'-untranslated region of the COB mRNA n=1 Tax=Geotrichum candidum TaxID=1173061 RepID=A0A0J9XA78_GEOCN|nr:similar to Saccharomyces cerevisiae YJL209W CBP1 Mitochondrial protein that interacts with the 5'-untranslated region of the COB mRNA [Geotrichum candidum]